MALIDTTFTTYNSSYNKRLYYIYTNKISCDDCGIIYECLQKIRNRKLKGKLSNNRDLCDICMKYICNNHIKTVGALALSKLTKNERILNASLGGIASNKSFIDNPNNSRFSTDRWNSLSDEQQNHQVTTANTALQVKLKDPIYSAKHYAKIFSQSKIGYMSKGHKDLHNLISDYGFDSHVQILNMQVDECNIELKIVVEYNGDMWHCNPRTWKCDDYNSAIRMTAGEKWRRDIARRAILEKMGYVLIVIWESQWIANAEHYLIKIKEIYNEINSKNKNTERIVL